MGSRKYPQQGYLDHIAAQYYSLGTNATTYRDMTTYELTTVNSRSISTLLPIYLDHVFNPLLTKDCYLTEVHHVAGETGEDAGVVYSEMQSSENQAEEILLFSIMRDLWSEKSPYYYESGGRLEAIRNELTLDKIKIFHQKFYTPKNVAIVLCGGGVNIDEILSLLNRFEQENFLGSVELTQHPSLEHQRKKTKLNNEEKFPLIHIRRASFDAASSSTDTLTNSNPTGVDSTKLSVHLNSHDGNESSFFDSELMVSQGDSSAPSSPSTSFPVIELDSGSSVRQMNEYKEVCYPVEDSDENLGQVAFGYRLESIYNMEMYTALDVLLTTLFDEDISIFYKEFVEIPNTLCSSIDHEWFNYPERVLTVTFEGLSRDRHVSDVHPLCLGIEVENLTLVADKYSSVLYSIINSPLESNTQLYTQIQQNIRKKIELHLNEIENEPFDFLTDLCCLDHISELSLSARKQHTETPEDDEQQHLHQFLRNKKYLDELLPRPLSYWYDLIRKYLLEWDSSKRTIILLKPSNDLLIEQQGNVDDEHCCAKRSKFRFVCLEQEEQRITDRLQALGPAGQAKLKDELTRARSNNQQASSQCAQVPSSSLPFNNQLHLPPIEYVSSEGQIDLFNSPTTQFNRYVLHIPFENLPSDLQSYLPLFSNLLFHTSIQHGEVRLDKYHFCGLVSRDILGCNVSSGQSSSSPIQSSYVVGHYVTQFIISLQSVNTLEIYQNTIDYLRYALFGSQFDDYKIIIEECEKQLKNLIETLQDGQTIHQSYFNSLLYSDRSNHYYHRMNLFVQKHLLEKICKHPEKFQKEIIGKLQRIKSFLWKNLSQMHLTICGNLETIKANWSIIERFQQESEQISEQECEQLDGKDLKDKHVPTLSPATIIGSPHEESG